CTGGSCGLKQSGAVCGSKDECLSGFCEQGICCATACTGVCKSCALSTTKGTCSNIPNGTVDVMSRCADQGAASCRQDGFCAGNCANIPAGTPDSMNRCTASPPCGNTGACNGAGACALASTTVSCGAQSCTGSTSTPLSRCNGTGGCITAVPFSCSPYTCGGD